jgi:hypothetical protein
LLSRLDGDAEGQRRGHPGQQRNPAGTPKRAEFAGDFKPGVARDAWFSFKVIGGRMP